MKDLNSLKSMVKAASLIPSSVIICGEDFIVITGLEKEDQEGIISFLKKTKTEYLLYYTICETPSIIVMKWINLLTIENLLRGEKGIVIDASFFPIFSVSWDNFSIPVFSSLTGFSVPEHYKHDEVKNYLTSLSMQILDLLGGGDKNSYMVLEGNYLSVFAAEAIQQKGYYSIIMSTLKMFRKYIYDALERTVQALKGDEE